MVQIVLSHDVDRNKKTYQTFSKGLKSLTKGNLKEFLFHLKTFQNKDVYWNIEDIIDIENSFGVKSTFFFLIETIPFELFNIPNWKLSLGRYDIFEERVVQAIQYLDKNGWEIGLHGSYNSFRDKDLLLKEKETLESILGKEVMGIRQHYLNLNEETWKFQNEVGFLYDSSYGYKRSIGFIDNNFQPFAPFENEFLEFPLTIMDFNFVKLGSDKWVQLEELYKKARDNNGIITINWHPNNYNTIEYPNFKQDYIQLIQYFKEKNCSFSTFQELYEELRMKI